MATPPPFSLSMLQVTTTSWKLTSAINLQIREERSVPGQGTSVYRGRLRKSKEVSDSMDALASRVTVKIEEGDYKGAVRLACGSDSIAEHSPETHAFEAETS